MRGRRFAQALLVGGITSLLLLLFAANAWRIDSKFSVQVETDSWAPLPGVRVSFFAAEPKAPSCPCSQRENKSLLDDVCFCDEQIQELLMWAKASRQEPLASSMTDDRGIATFSRVPSGAVVVRFEKSGFASVTLPVTDLPSDGKAIRLAHDRPFSLRFVDGITQKSVPDVEALAVAKAPPEVIPLSVVDARAELWPQEKVAYVLARAPGYSDRFVEAPSAKNAPDAGLTVNLWRVCSLRGRVMRQGAPAQGASVCTRGRHECLKTDQSGGFTLSDVSVTVAHDLSAQAPGFVAEWHDSTPDMSGACPPSDGIVLELAPAFTLKVKVLAPNGKPVAHATVTLDGGFFHTDQFVQQSRETDDEGLFTASDLPAGNYELRVSATGWVYAEQEVRLGKSIQDFAQGAPEHQPGEQHNVTVTLQRLITVSGRVLDPKGHPISGAEVRAYPDEEPHWSMICVPTGLGSAMTKQRFPEAYGYAKSDTDGRFSMNEIPSGKLRLEVDAPGWPDFVKKLGADDDTLVELELRATLQAKSGR
jgi:protocatechuate 3,4-dioxygenase beta subunit